MSCHFAGGKQTKKDADNKKVAADIEEVREKIEKL